MFISGGENIHPETIEQAICEHPTVVQAIVVPDAFFSFPPEILAGGLKPSRAALKRLVQELTESSTQ
jgi:acyl-CoA synthetase (AMP-forming)/AMP-acid ligase II